MLFPFLLLFQATVFFTFIFICGQARSTVWFVWCSISVFILLAGTQIAVVRFFHRAADLRSRKNQLLGEFINEVNREILLNEDEKKVFATVLEYAFRILENVELGSILAFDKTGDLAIVASRGFNEDFVRNFHLPLEETFQYNQSGGNITQAMIISPEIIRNFRHRLDSGIKEFRSIISVPLFVGGTLYGFLNVDSELANNFSNDDLQLLKNFGSHIEVSLFARQQYRLSLEKSRLDVLTGFLSRSYFMQIFDHTLDHAKRYEGRFVLGMFDVDNLKAVNDSFGHPAGDRVLQVIAEAVRKAARKSDVVGRYGGDEFIGIYYNTDAKRMTEQIIRVQTELENKPLFFGTRQTVASFCYGFAEYPSEADSFGSLVAVADASLYRMKTERKKRG